MALSRTKSLLHEALHSGNMSNAHDHESCRVGGGLKEEAAAP